jgi:hypothetical protein
MDDDKTLYLVFSNPVAGREDDFNEWYDNVHVPEVLATPGMVTAQRFSLADVEMNRAEGMPAQSHAYLTVYEMEGDVDATMAKIGEAVMSGTMSMSDSLDLPSTVMSYWTPRGPKVTK